ncbi:efflux RND transporter permease subunit [Rubinisphaera sp.]|uniref:efflux RND transporter permease subunit n=1 Tax=Rubinisphaera sp. TaxID=2024857 RepID=UPI000C0D0981|nr:efflux RND transporter permease subunit [Rubinisphaera sp.]MBV08729.1 RND transporter [Rubinisphaera sp.]HCS54767.1 AcrB/AcrD/AcrF family protein [Planctomycetaceae bacterium]|tara:strand:+ start:27 stop:3359 length:3333 start_codon:yes stop_codon:yes gene_type:complete
MNLSTLSIRYRPIVLTFVGLVTVWGVITFATMPRREDPEFTIRTCVVSTQWPGSPTIKVEELVTDKLEEELDSIEEIDYLNSETTNGQSVIYVNLEDNVPPGDIQQVWDKVRAKVDLVPMPDPGIHPIVNDEFGDTTILLLGIYQVPLEGEEQIDEENRYSPRELEIYTDKVKDAIRLLPGVAKVEKYGVQDEAIFIEADLGTWSQLDLTSSTLKDLLKARNIVAPGGTIDTLDGKFNVKPGGEFDAMSEIETLTVGTVQSGNSSNQVSLNDLGLSVKRDYEDPPSVISRFTEERGTFPAVMLGLTMKSGSNIVDVCENAMARIDQLVNIEQALPRDIVIRPVSQQSDNVTAKIDDVINNVISAILIVVVVVYLFLGVRTSLVMAANIPFVVLGSIAIVSLFGVELEQISLASIIIALGLLVDNAVQVCDQTRTNILEGMTPTDAAVSGTNTLMFPMLTGTLTTVAAFLPMLFALEGGSAEYVYSLPVTLSTTLLLSWLYAMTICVVLAASVIRAPKNPDRPSAPLPWLNEWFEKLRRRKSSGNSSSTNQTRQKTDNIFMQIYGATAWIAIKYKWISAIAAMALLFAILQLPVSSEFFPLDRRDQFYVNIKLPETATIEQTNAVVIQVESAIKKLSPVTDQNGNEIERLRTMRSIVAQGGARWALSVAPQPAGSNTAQILVRTTNGSLTDGMIGDLRQAVDSGNKERGILPIAGARITAKRLQMGPDAAPVELRVSGDGFADINKLRGIAEEVKLMLREQSGTWDIADSWGIDGFQLNVNVDQEKANLSGITNAAVADTLNSYFTGLELTTFREGDHLVPVYFRLRPEDRQDLTGIDTAFVEGVNGKIPLNSVATITPVWQPAKIDRRNQNRTIEVTAEVEDGVQGNDIVLNVWNSDRMKTLRESLPVGYRIEIGGALEESQDASVQMMTSFGISILCIILILVIQYNGWSKMVVILMTLPLAMIGAWFGLWVTQNPLGFMSQLGLLSLFGIVLNTGIIFIEFADILITQKRDELSSEGKANGPIAGLNVDEFRDCLISAGKQRMLPIFLTTATTIGGLFPLALSGGPLWEGMAWLMIYGLLAATVLTLYIIPALYAILVETFRIRPINN